jgi:5-phospho-D-xylono-1,4-lactonase
MSFVRTALGDIDAATLGACDAHEHVIIDPSYATEQEPDFLLDDVDRAVEELTEFKRCGGDWLIDTMPTDCGRNAAKLAEVSRRSGVHIVVPTGVHLAKYYPPGHSILSMNVDQLATMMAGEIEDGIDGTAIRAGVIKIAGGRDLLSPFERSVFAAAAQAHHATGCPIITHTEQGTAVDEQIDLLEAYQVDLSRVTLSHTDRCTDIESHRRWLRRGVKLEYDNHFRSKKTPNPTIALLNALAPEFPHQLMVGMDAARRSYWKSHGGTPGLAYLVTTLREALELSREAAERVYVLNPREAFSLCRRGRSS